MSQVWAEMGEVWYVLPWVLTSTLAGLFVGARLGRGPTKREAKTDPPSQRQAALKMLTELLATAERMGGSVESHNTQIRQSAQQVGNLRVGAEMETVKQALLAHMTGLLNSNKTMQEDLLCTRYRLEEQAVELDRARREARSDELTGVHNRRAFNEKLHLLLDGWRRQQEPFVLIVVDLDQFKRINDAYGHPCGDRVLKTVGDWLRQLVREVDFVARHGGDEFTILLPRTRLDVGRKIALAVCRRIAEKAWHFAAREGEVSLSVSVGVAAPRENDSDESIFERADRAMYKCKGMGGNRVLCEDPKDEPVPV